MDVKHWRKLLLSWGASCCKWFFRGQLIRLDLSAVAKVFSASLLRALNRTLGYKENLGKTFTPVSGEQLCSQTGLGWVLTQLPFVGCLQNPGLEDIPSQSAVSVLTGGQNMLQETRFKGSQVPSLELWLGGFWVPWRALALWYLAAGCWSWLSSLCCLHSAC